MDKEEIVRLIEQSRTSLLNQVNLEFDRIKSIALGEETDCANETFFIDIPLFSNASVFKGRKPINVIFEDGTICDTPTWKLVAKALLDRCYSNPNTRKRLYEMCGLIRGKNRLLLSHDCTEMNVPIAVADDMFFETKFDAETLMNVLVKRILIPAGFDGNGTAIKVHFKHP